MENSDKEEKVKSSKLVGAFKFTQKTRFKEAIREELTVILVKGKVIIECSGSSLKYVVDRQRPPINRNLVFETPFIEMNC